MKKINFIKLLFVSASIISCTKSNQTSDNVGYEALKDMKMSDMSTKNQQLVKAWLIDILKDDEDFAMYSKSFQYIVMARLERIKNGHNKPMGLPPKDFDEKMDFYKNNGIKKPKEMIVNEVNMVLAVSKMRKKYPELKNLDRITFNEVLKQAVAKWNPDLSDQLGGMMKPRSVKR